MRSGQAISGRSRIWATSACFRPILHDPSAVSAVTWVQNLETARAVEDVVRQHGATPATIAILGGVPHIGLTDAELVSLASRCYWQPLA